MASTYKISRPSLLDAHLANVVGEVYERNGILFVVLAAGGGDVVLAPLIYDNLGTKRDDVPIQEPAQLAQIGIFGGRWLVRVNELCMCREFEAMARGAMETPLLDQVQSAAAAAAYTRVSESRDEKGSLEDSDWSKIWSWRLHERRGDAPAKHTRGNRTTEIE